MADKIKEEEKYEPDIKDLKEKWDICISYYAKEHRRMRLLDATDRGQLWKALEVRLPPYQILPDTNFVSYVKNNLLASIYTVAKGASIQPASNDDKEIVNHVNIALERIWDLNEIGYFQFLAGERAALLNLGITQVGWNPNKVPKGNKDNKSKGDIEIKNISPIKFMRDPFATDLPSSSYCITFESFHKSVFLQDSRYKEEFKKYYNSKDRTDGMTTPQYRTSDYFQKNGAKDYFVLVIFWVREGNKIHEVHTIDAKHVLHTREDIKPSKFPFAELYCNIPADDLVGTSECAKIFANNVAYNLMHSIALTAEYKNQRPPKFVSESSGLNIHSFSKHGDEADRTFVVNGDASRAVHYHEFPQISGALPQMMGTLAQDTQLVSGVDGRYTGRDTGSIITTGGTEEMLNRVTLIDTPKIECYHKYARQLTELVLSNLCEFGQKRLYFYKKPNTNKFESLEIEFPKLDEATMFNYVVNISSELPKNKQRIAAMANMLMEKQMQYSNGGQQQVQLITPEEWLMFQDLPNREMMLERMGIQRLTGALEDATQVITEYADLLGQGVAPQDALMATSNTLAQRRSGQMPDMGPTAPPPMDQESMPM